MLKWALVVMGVLVAIPVLMAVVGLFLPKGHVATTRARIAQSPEAVWSVLTDFPRWPEWNRAVRSMERSADRGGKPVWVANGSWGRMPSIIETFDPPRTMVTRIPEDAGLGFTGSWTYELTPVEGGTLLSITERGEVSNPLFRFMGAVFFDQHAAAAGFLKSLGKKFGESVQPEKVS